MKGGTCPCSGSTISGGSIRRKINKSRRSRRVIRGGDTTPPATTPVSTPATGTATTPVSTPATGTAPIPVSTPATGTASTSVTTPATGTASTSATGKKSILSMFGFEGGSSRKKRSNYHRKRRSQTHRRKRRV